MPASSTVISIVIKKTTTTTTGAHCVTGYWGVPERAPHLMSTAVCMSFVLSSYLRMGNIRLGTSGSGVARLGHTGARAPATSACAPSIARVASSPGFLLSTMLGREASQRETAWLGPLCEVGVYTV